MMVYPTPMAKNCHWFATKELAKLGYENLHTVHRLDRPTSGLLLFARNKEAARAFSLLFRENKMEKKYRALVRGHIPEEGEITKALKKDGEGEEQEASTHFKCLKNLLLDEEIGRYPQARYSYVEVSPKTGRMHQIRRHFSHLRNPIIGDKKYGDREHNNFFKKSWEMDRLFLHSHQLSFFHPFKKEQITLEAPIPEEFTLAMSKMELIKSIPHLL